MKNTYECIVCRIAELSTFIRNAAYGVCMIAGVFLCLIIGHWVPVVFYVGVGLTLLTGVCAAAGFRDNLQEKKNLENALATIPAIPADEES